MSPSCPDRITLTGSQRRALARLVRAGRTEQRLVTRAEIVLAAAEGQSTARIAAALRVCEDTVRKWRRRWCAAPGVASLRDAHRCGRPRVFGRCQVAEVKAMACTPPADAGLPMSRWSCPELAAEAVAGGAARRSRRRRCAAGWPRTPSSRGSTGRGSSRATPTSPPRPPGCWTSTPGAGTGTAGRRRVRDLARTRRPRIQARCRCHPTLPPGKARAMRVEHEYDRGGALAYLAAYDVHRAHGVRPLRAHHRDRAVRPAGRPGHDHRALRLRRAGVLDRRQRLLPPRPGLDRPAGQGVARTAIWSTCRSTPPG